VHPGCVVVPAVLALGYDRCITGAALIEAVVAGYEAEIAIGRAVHPDLRQRGFHPAATCGVFGSVMAAGKLRGLTTVQLANALGLAASSAAGIFAFVNGGADIKRLHAGHASREGLQAALLAEQGVEGPPDVIEARDGFMQAFAFGRTGKPRAIALPPAVPFGITDCYIKPYPCCRHIQPAVEALMGLLNDEKIANDEVEHIDVATYRIAAEHAETGWNDFASAQLSFPYLMGVALKHRGIRFEHFSEEMRRDPAFTAIARKLSITAPPDVDRLYPQLRPARVTVKTARGNFTRHADEALGSRIVPLDDAGLRAKFLDLVGPVLGADRAKELNERIWSVADAADVAPLVEALAK
jgi:2-methylcitrate dehydratase PrpD